MQGSSAVLEKNLERLHVSAEGRQRLSASGPGECRVEGSNPDEQQLLVRGEGIYGGTPPVQQAALEARNLIGGKSPGLIVFFGLGLCWHPRFLRENTTAPILIFEPRMDLAFAALSSTALELDNIYLATHPDEFEDLLLSLVTEGGSELIAGALPAMTRLAPEAFADFKGVLQKTLEKQQIDLRTRSTFSYDWVANIAANLPVLGRLKPLEALRETMAGQPAVIVAAGPSFDRNAQALKDLGERAFVIAVHSSVAPLHEVGVVPDAVAIIEGQKLDGYFTGAALEDVILLPSPQTHPIHLTLGFREVLGLSLEGMATADWFKGAYGEKALPSGGSVTCTAFSLLHHLGCDPLILMGADFSYTDERGHARKNENGCCTFDLQQDAGIIRTRCTEGVHEEFEYQAQMAEGWGSGEPVLTRPELSSFRHWFEAASRTWAADRRLINATEGGSRVRGFHEMPLHQALREFGKDDLNPKGRLARALEGASCRAVPPLEREVAGELDRIRQSRKGARHVLGLIPEPRKRLKKKQLTNLQPLLDRLNSGEKNLQAATRETRLLNTLVGHRARSLATGSKPKDKVGATLHSLKLSEAIAQLVVEGADELESLLGPALEAMGEESE